MKPQPLRVVLFLAVGLLTIVLIIISSTWFGICGKKYLIRPAIYAFIIISTQVLRLLGVNTPRVLFGYVVVLVLFIEFVWVPRFMAIPESQ